MGHEFPRQTAVAGRVDVDLRVGQVGRDGVTRGEDRAGFIPAEGLLKEVQERLVAEAPVVGLVGYVGDVRPCLA